MAVGRRVHKVKDLLHYCNVTGLFIWISFFPNYSFTDCQLAIATGHCANYFTISGAECTAFAISFIREVSFSMALPTTITSAPALQFR